MYQCGQLVVYGSHGVCRVLPHQEKIIDRKPVQYYVLEPLEQPGSRYFVPMGNPTALARLSSLLTPQQLDALLEEQRQKPYHWIPEENRRKQYYRELLGSGDRGAMVAMVRTLHRHRKMQQEQGKKFHMCDENFLREAERLLSAEFSLVLQLDKSQVEAYIRQKLE